MGATVAHQRIKSHLVSGAMLPGQEIGIRIDQTLTQDATGTLVMLELVNFGVLPVTLEDEAEYDQLATGDVLVVTDLYRSLRERRPLRLENTSKRRTFSARHERSEREAEMLLRGGLINWVRARLTAPPARE